MIVSQELYGLGTYALVEKLISKYGQKNSVVCIGPAGEYKLKSASVQSTDVDGRPCRAAGRGGLGAVMGAKGLKAIIVDQNKKGEAPLADPEGFKKAAKVFAKTVKDNPFCGTILPEYGTAWLVAAVNGLGTFPCYNATKGLFDGQEKISGETLLEMINARGGKNQHMSCSQCIMHYSNEFVDEKGEYVTA